MRSATVVLIIFALLLCVVLLSGCSMTGTMAPVEGPLSKLAPAPFIKFKADGITGNTGNFSLRLPDGSAAGAGITIGAGSLLGRLRPYPHYRLFDINRQRPESRPSAGELRERSDDAV